MDADLNDLERALIRTIRCAHVLYHDGAEDEARRVMQTEAIPMMVGCVQFDESFAVHESLTMPVMGGRVEA